MSYVPVTAIVRSSDGVEFAVATEARSIHLEQIFAAKHTAAELEQHGDFVHVSDAQAVTEVVLRSSVACDPSHEALCRAQARWHTAAVLQGDKS